MLPKIYFLNSVNFFHWHIGPFSPWLKISYITLNAIWLPADSGTWELALTSRLPKEPENGAWEKKLLPFFFLGDNIKG